MRLDKAKVISKMTLVATKSCDRKVTTFILTYINLY